MRAGGSEAAWVKRQVRDVSTVRVGVDVHCCAAWACIVGGVARVPHALSVSPKP
jgi:hypothetical protein